MKPFQLFKVYVRSDSHASMGGSNSDASTRRRWRWSGKRSNVDKSIIVHDRLGWGISFSLALSALAKRGVKNLIDKLYTMKWNSFLFPYVSLIRNMGKKIQKKHLLHLGHTSPTKWLIMSKNPNFHHHHDGITKLSRLQPIWLKVEIYSLAIHMEAKGNWMCRARLIPTTS